MRYIRIILFFWFLCQPIVFFTQKYIFDWGESHEKSRQEKALGFFHVDNEYFLFLGDHNELKTLHFCVYDSNMMNQFHTTLDFKKHKVLKIDLIEKKPVVFTAFTNADGEEELYAHNISIKGELSSKLLITKLKNNGGYKTVYKIAVSKNKEHIAVLVEQPFKKDENEKITLLILNQDLTINNHIDETLKLKDKHKRVNVPIITNDGYFYLIKRYFEKGNRYFLFCREGSQLVNLELKLNNHKIADMQYAIDPKGKLKLAGFYSSQVRLNFEGIYSFEFNKSLKYQYRKNQPLTGNIINAFKSKKEIKDKGFGLDGFRAKKLLLDSVGDQYLIAEHHLYKYYKSEYEHFRKGLVVIKVSKNGNFIWGYPILTKQNEKSKIEYWSSSTAFVLSNGLNICYNVINQKYGKLEDIYGKNTLYGSHLVTFSNHGLSENEPIVGFHEKGAINYAMYPEIILQENQDVFFITENAERDIFRIVKAVFQ